MPDKLKFGDVGSDYEPSLSEDEYSDGEKELLKKVRRRRNNEQDEDDENQQQAVLGFDEDEDYDEEDDDEPDFEEIRKFEHDSDIDDKDEDDDLPDRRAWGTKSGVYYGTGYIDRDYDTLTAQEEELARLEEEEAMEMRKRLMQGMTEEDFALDDLMPDEQEDKETDPAADFEKEVIVIQSDLSKLDERERLELFRKTSPEFAGLVKECAAKLKECVQVLQPVLELLKKHRKLSHPLGQLLAKRYELNTLYCSNISFYVLLKSQNQDIRHHPLVKRIMQLKRLVQEMDQKYEQSVKSQVEQLLTAQAEGLRIIFHQDAVDEMPKTKKTSRLRMPVQLAVAEPPSGSDEEQSVIDSSDDDTEHSMAKRHKLDTHEEDDEMEHGSEVEAEDGALDVNGKRKITYQMAKNKGLTARKRKDQRNIRVKNKLKYRKALVRRKGSIREVRTETTRYEGERSIKPFVKRGIKLK